MPVTLPQEVGEAQSGSSSCIIDIIENIAHSPSSLFSFHTKNKSDLNWNYNHVSTSKRLPAGLLMFVC